MGKHTGKNGKVKFGANFVAGLDGWSIEETVETEDLTSADSVAMEHETMKPGWSGTCNLLLDHEDSAKQTPRAGDSVAFEGYTEGDATGKTYYSGTVSVTSVGVDSPQKGAVKRNIAFQGNGALSTATVTG